MTNSVKVPETRRAAPARRIVGREIHGSQVTDRLECGHTVTARYTGYQASRKCVPCGVLEALEPGGDGA
jgi:hypothetical protein